MLIYDNLYDTKIQTKINKKKKFFFLNIYLKKKKKIFENFKIR
jgi:hypothetical protein